ncbi:unnamed protein product [Arabidopsis halleri]
MLTRTTRERLKRLRFGHGGISLDNITKRRRFDLHKTTSFCDLGVLVVELGFFLYFIVVPKSKL